MRYELRQATLRLHRFNTVLNMMLLWGAPKDYIQRTRVGM